MPEFSDNVIQVFRWKRGATEQGGLLSGKDPSEFNSADPLRLWIIQIGVIVATASLLSLGLRKIRQPKVIAEVLGGIILGPTAFGSIPGFTEHIFPQESRPFLSLTANIGLCLFLFLVGLEIDAGVIQRNARLSATVALAGMVIPFGIGAGLSKAIYDQFIDESVKFTNFMLFAGVAFSITAFPVLCRILTELKLLDTTVGIVVLSAGVGNDIIGWTLLALSVALVNAGSGLTALYILLCCVGYTLFLLFPGKWALKWLARETGSLESGPTVLFMTVTMLVLFGSAFFTDIIGVHAIFGAFVTGIIVPREGGLAIALTEKLEDMVAIIFLPLYFTLSGLSTNLQLLDDGITWGYTIAIIFTAFIGKFGGCSLAARYAAGFNWRESGAIGSLMSCKGLVELIVLNVGLSAGILTQRVFSMFVLEALVLTFITTPLVLQFYPPHVRKRVTTTGPSFDHVSDGEEDAKPRITGDDSTTKRRFTVVLDKLEHLPGVMALSQLIQPAYHTPASQPQATGMGRAPSQSSTSKHRLSSIAPRLTPPTSVEALRLIELSDRTSAVMRSSASDALLRTDPVMAIYRMFGQLNCLPIIPRVAIVPYDDLSYTVAEHAKNHGSDLILLPWLPPHLDQGVGNEVSVLSPASGVIQLPDMLSPTSHIVSPASHNVKSPTNPFEMLFRTGAAGSSNTNSAKSPALIHSQFVRGVFSEAGKYTNVALFVDQSSPSVAGMMSMVGTGPQHVFLPFFGGPDDRLALDFVVQMCENNEKMRATVAKMVKREVTVTEPPSGDNGFLRPPPPARTASDGKMKVPTVREDINVMSAQSTFSGLPDTVYGQHNTETRMMSETADNIAWAKYATPPADSPTSPALSRIRFHELVSPVPLHAAIQEASSACYDHGLDGGEETEAAWAPQGLGDRLVVVTGRSRRLAVENHTTELNELMEEYGTVGSTVKKTIGDVATAFVVAGVGTGVVVLQAATST